MLCRYMWTQPLAVTWHKLIGCDGNAAFDGGMIVGAVRGAQLDDDVGLDITGSLECEAAAPSILWFDC